MMFVHYDELILKHNYKIEKLDDINLNFINNTLFKLKIVDRL